MSVKSRFFLVLHFPGALRVLFAIIFSYPTTASGIIIFRKNWIIGKCNGLAIIPCSKYGKLTRNFWGVFSTF